MSCQATSLQHINRRREDVLTAENAIQYELIHGMISVWSVNVSSYITVFNFDGGQIC